MEPISYIAILICGLLAVRGIYQTYKSNSLLPIKKSVYQIVATILVLWGLLMLNVGTSDGNIMPITVLIGIILIYIAYRILKISMKTVSIAE
jgi:hypothetical protein